MGVAHQFVLQCRSDACSIAGVKTIKKSGRALGPACGQEARKVGRSHGTEIAAGLCGGLEF